MGPLVVTGGHVGIGQRADQADLEDKLGHDAASVLWDMGLEAVDTVKALISDHDIKCDLKHGDMHLAHKARLCDGLKEEVEFLADRYNFTDMEYIPQERLSEFVGSDGFLCRYLGQGFVSLAPFKLCPWTSRCGSKSWRDDL